MTTFARPKPTAGTPTDALLFVRNNRHYEGCPCRRWRDGNGAPYCTPAEAMWSRALNRLLDQARNGRERL